MASQYKLTSKWCCALYVECFIEILSWGGNDATTFSGYIAINGDREISTPTGAYRGFNLAELNLGSCSASKLSTFDTWASAANSDAMATYINTLPLNTVLIGITSDEPQAALNQNARNALLAIGVNVVGLQNRGKVSFVAQIGIGRSVMTVSQVAPAGGANLELAVNVTGI